MLLGILCSFSEFLCVFVALFNRLEVFFAGGIVCSAVGCSLFFVLSGVSVKCAGGPTPPSLASRYAGDQMFFELFGLILSDPEAWYVDSGVAFALQHFVFGEGLFCDAPFIFPF